MSVLTCFALFQIKKNHIIVAQYVLTRYPDAKIVSLTSVKPVLKAMHQIYTDYGHPDFHRTDNGHPFNSTVVTDFSQSRDITHDKVYPFHPQANLVETFMKPLGKAMNVAHYNKDDKKTVLNNMLSSYRATPYPATGVPSIELFLQTSLPTQRITQQH